MASKNSIGGIALDLEINGRDYKRQVSSIAKTSEKSMNNAAVGMENSFKSSFSRIGKMAIAAFSIATIGNFVKSCLDLGSALTEVQNVVDVSFPTMNGQINNFAKNAITNFGLSETLAKRYAGTFGSMAQAFKFTEAEAAEMATTLTGLAGDVASFYNMDADLAYTKLKSVFSGETETLKDLGIVMTQTALDSYAMEKGIGKTTSAMSEQEKVLLRYQFIQDQLKFATGDFVRTQDSWANQTRVLTLQWESFKASIGKGLIALFTPIVKGINWVLSHLQVLADSFASLMEMLTGYSGDTGSGGLATATDDLGGVTDAADSAGESVGSVGDGASAAAKKIQKAFAKVDTINKLSFGSDSDSGSGSGTSGGSGASGSVADAVDFPDTTKQATVFDGMLKGLIDEFKRLSAIFVDGFAIGFGNSFKDLDRLKDYIFSIGDSLVNVFTDPNVTNAAGRWVDSWILAVGKLVGSIASIGVTFATLFVGSIATYLDRNVNFIKEKLVSIFDISAENNEIVGNFYVVLADIASVFSSNEAIAIGSNLIAIIANGALNGIHLFLEVSNEILNKLFNPIIENKDVIKASLIEMFSPLEDITGDMATLVTDFSSFTTIVSLAASAFAGFKVLSILTPLAVSFGGALASVGGAISSWGILSTLKGLAFTILPSLSGILSTVGLFFGQFTANLAAGGGIIHSLTVGLGACGTSFGSIGTSLIALINPVTLVIAAIAALVAGFVYAYTSSEEFRKKVDSIFSKIASSVGGIISGLVAIIKTIWDKGLKPVIDSTLEGLKKLWDGGLSTFIENTSLFILNLVNGILSLWDNALNPLINLLLTIFLPIVTMVWDTILAIVVPILSNIMDFVGRFMGILSDLMALLNECVWPIFKEVFNGLSEAVNIFWGIVQPIFKWFTDLLSSVIDFAMKWFLAPFRIMIDSVIVVVKAITDPVKQVFEGIKNIFKGIIDFVTGIFTGDWKKAWDGIKSIFKGMWDSLSGIVSAVWNAITSLFSNGGKIFSGVVDGIANVFKTIVNSLVSGINNVIAIPFNTINGILNGIKKFSVLGQKPFYGLWGYNPLPVPRLPYLAQGGYVKANTPQLAMIGDNRHQGEVVAPEGKMVDMINTALSMQKESGSSEGIKEVIILLKKLIALVSSLYLSTDIDLQQLAISLKQAEKDVSMIGG